jgi:UDP-N-acetylmuramoyl-L-alanyl-D-glutamate--2,6-diaminopimelate ligase
VVTFGRATRADVLPLELATTIDGLRLKLRTPKGDVVVVSALLGRTNVANIMAAMAAACALDLNLEDAAAGIHEVKSIPGRAERIDEGQEFLVLVDYAHTDDALIQILSSARELAAGRLLVVFGCGGDRDNSKRALMGAAAARLADMAFLTSDNPRSEDPLVILEQVVSGFGGQNPAVAPVIEPDRTAAIHAAIAEARPGDVLVIAGKGHETRQILAHGNIPFDDREVARQALRNRFGKDT